MYACVLAYSIITAQRPGTIKAIFLFQGKVIDKETKQPLEYATVVFKEHTKVNKLSGGITDNEGAFLISKLPRRNI